MNKCSSYSSLQNALCWLEIEAKKVTSPWTSLNLVDSPAETDSGNSSLSDDGDGCTEAHCIANIAFMNFHVIHKALFQDDDTAWQHLTSIYTFMCSARMQKSTQEVKMQVASRLKLLYGASRGAFAPPVSSAAISFAFFPFAYRWMKVISDSFLWDIAGVQGSCDCCDLSLRKIIFSSRQLFQDKIAQKCITTLFTMHTIHPSARVKAEICAFLSHVSRNAITYYTFSAPLSATAEQLSCVLEGLPPFPDLMSNCVDLFVSSNTRSGRGKRQKGSGKEELNDEVKFSWGQDSSMLESMRKRSKYEKPDVDFALVHDFTAFDSEKGKMLCDRNFDELQKWKELLKFGCLIQHQIRYDLHYRKHEYCQPAIMHQCDETVMEVCYRVLTANASIPKVRHFPNVISMLYIFLNVQHCPLFYDIRNDVNVCCCKTCNIGLSPHLNDDILKGKVMFDPMISNITNEGIVLSYTVGKLLQQARKNKQTTHQRNLKAASKKGRY